MSSSDTRLAVDDTAGRSPFAGARRAVSATGSTRSRKVGLRRRRFVRRPPTDAGSSSSTSGVARQRRGRDHRHVEADEEPRASGSSPRRRATTSAVSRITSRPQFRQIRPADARIQQAQVVVDLGGRARPSTGDCGCCSSGGSRSPDRCPQSSRCRASPSARGTAGRRRTAIRRSAADPRRRWCRRRATTSPSRSRRS